MAEWLEKTFLNKDNVSYFLNEKEEPGMCISRGRNILGRRTRRKNSREYKALMMGTHLVMIQKQEATVAGVQKWSQCVDWDESRVG